MSRFFGFEKGSQLPYRKGYGVSEQGINVDVVVEIEKSQACGLEKGGQAAGGFIVQEFPQPVGGIDPDPRYQQKGKFPDRG